MSHHYDNDHFEKEKLIDEHSGSINSGHEHYAQKD